MTNSNINRLALIVAVLLLLWSWFGPDLFGAPAPSVDALAGPRRLIDPDLLDLFSLVITSATGIILAFLTFKTAALNKAQTKSIEIQTESIKSQIKVAEQIQELEKNTNSMKDELVKTTELMSRAEGVIIGKQAAKAEQALIAEGISQAEHKKEVKKE